MPRTPDFQASDIDLAAAIMTATGERPEISRDPGRELGTFHYPAVDAVHAVALAYASVTMDKQYKGNMTMTPYHSIAANARRIQLLLRADFPALQVSVYVARIRAACAYLSVGDKDKPEAK